MAANVNIYWPRATVMGEDGSVTELKVEEGYTNLWLACEKVREWKREHGKGLGEPRIETRGEKGRLKYTISIED